MKRLYFINIYGTNEVKLFYTNIYIEKPCELFISIRWLIITLEKNNLIGGK